MQTGYQSSRYHDKERGEEYNACNAYNDYCNGHDKYNTCYYSDEGYGTYNSDGDYAHASINNYDVGNCGYTDEYDGCCYYTNDGYHCNNEYGRYYNEYYGCLNKYVGPETDGNETNFPLNDDSIKEMCGVADHTNNRATEMKLATVTNKIDRLNNRLTKAVKHLTERKQISPKIVDAIEHLTTEKEEMAGILECPEKQQRTMEKLANNRFAALREEEEMDYGGRLTITEMCATDRHVTIINYDGILVREPNR